MTGEGRWGQPGRQVRRGMWYLRDTEKDLNNQEIVTEGKGGSQFPQLELM